MKYDWLNDYILSKKGVTQKYDTNHTYYFLGEKRFAEMEQTDARSAIHFKMDKSTGWEFVFQNQNNMGMGKYISWRVVWLDGDMPDDTLKKIVDHSYKHQISKLSKKEVKEILGSDVFICE